MKVVKPVDVSDAMLVSSSLEASSAAAWTAGTSYGVGQRVQVDRRLYESVAAANVGHAPAQDTDVQWWTDVGPSNRWAMFDQEINTQSVAAAAAGVPVSISVTLAPGMCNSLAALELVGNALEVLVMDGVDVNAQQVYHRVLSLDNAVVTDWYQYFFEPSSRNTEVLLQDLPPFGSARITLTLRGLSEVRIGSLVVGTTYTLGDLNYGARLGINDYSKKSTNDFGVTRLVRREFSKRADVPLTLDTDNLQRVYRLLAELRSTVCLWIGSDDPRLAPLNVFGFYKEFSIDLRVNNLNYCTLSIEGMI